MSLSDQVTWFLIGCFVGFVFGYIVRTLGEIKEELAQVDALVGGHPSRKRHSERFNWLAKPKNWVLLVVVLTTAFAAFSSQRASNESERLALNAVEIQKDILDTQAQLTAVSACNTKFQARTIQALNLREAYTTHQIDANISLSEKEGDFLEDIVAAERNVLVRQLKIRQSGARYLRAIERFLRVSEFTRDKAISNRFPEDAELASCVEDALDAKG